MGGEHSPFFRVLDEKGESESLAKALGRRRLPAAYERAQILLLTGWSWEEYLDTPQVEIDRVKILHNVRTAIETNTDLTFPGDKPAEVPGLTQ